MTLNKSKGNMYPWVTHTWNPIKGKCPHECIYCYVPDMMRGKPQGELRLDEKCLKDNLGSGKTIFVGSSTDMWAKEVRFGWLLEVVNHCLKFNDNTYLFQTKNPARFNDLWSMGYPKNVILGTTIETDRDTPEISKSPAPFIRIRDLEYLTRKHFARTMVSIEPIIDFDLFMLVTYIRQLRPKFVSIGADSKGHKLPEPSPKKVRALIEELKKFTEVKIKDNLARILKTEGKE